MAKTIKELHISLSLEEVEAILKKALADKLGKDSIVNVSYIIGTDYSGCTLHDDRGTDVVKEVIVTATVNSEIEL